MASAPSLPLGLPERLARAHAGPSRWKARLVRIVAGYKLELGVEEVEQRLRELEVGRSSREGVLAEVQPAQGGVLGHSATAHCALDWHAAAVQVMLA